MIEEIKIDSSNISIQFKSSQEKEILQNLFASSDPNQAISDLFEDQVKICYPQNLKNGFSCVKLVKHDKIFTYEEIVKIIQQLDSQKNLMDKKLAIKILKDAKKKITNKKQHFYY